MNIKTFYLSVALACMASCNNNASTNTEADSKTETTAEETKPEANPMEELAGTWVCEEKASIGSSEIQGMKVPGVSASAKITYTLKADGTFDSKGETMGVGATVSGSWKVEGGKVVMNANGETQMLSPNEQKTTLTEQATGMVMTKQ